MHVRANLKEIGDLDDLAFEFGLSKTNKSENERDLLENLRPHADLKKLIVSYYAATSFPSWMGDHSFQSMTPLCLSNCAFCDFLPRLGQLPSLKVLTIEGMNKVWLVGAEFYGCGSPFCCLEEVAFRVMKEWEEWIVEGPLPQLESITELHLQRCDLRLPEGLLPLHISECPALEFCCSHNDGLPSSIQSLDIWKVKKMELPKLISAEWMQLYSLLRNLTVSDDVGSVSFSLGVLPNLLHLQFWRCENLENIYIPEGRGITAWNGLKSLLQLSIFDCPKLEHVARKGLRAPNLKALLFRGCENLKSLPSWMCTNLSSLRHLHVRKCPVLEPISEREFPHGLIMLEIDNFQQLTSH
ncbi:hypothetical protein Ancab_022338 [Ancistrocladus abbreviatus]